MAPWSGGSAPPDEARILHLVATAAAPSCRRGSGFHSASAALGTLPRRSIIPPNRGDQAGLVEFGRHVSMSIVLSLGAGVLVGIVVATVWCDRRQGS
jgi:hypothetical protein